jgi:glycosyltransferase involved in cell wall biosynthesis
LTLKNKKLLFLVSEDWYFRSHRLPIARAARDAGALVSVATRVRDAGDLIKAEGFRLFPLGLSRSGRNPFQDLRQIYDLYRLYRRERPDIVHHVALKPSLYGSIAARLAGVPHIVNAFAGMGFVFISNGLFARTIRPILSWLFRYLLNRDNTLTIVQNADDAKLFVERIGVAPQRLRIIRGSGVDVDRFKPAAEPRHAETPVAVCVSRMLWDKGVGELVDAAKLLKSRGVPVRVRLVGPVDDNPASIPKSQLDEWTRAGVVDVAGPSDDIPGVYAAADIAVLPSYREGLPKSLLEAAAAGLPLVATDAPGCREICRDGKTGLLVPVQSVAPLADALARLANDPALRAELGANARRAAVEEFSEAQVVAETLDLYRSLLPDTVEHR